ncbi:hypothetical protein IMSAGC021_00889 [Muribaculaceae bacterium]|nr:hypothetical protein IMSAGC021_00889 [Muribaculaceae bacterium]
MAMITRASTIYAIAITGTTISLTREMRCTPPQIMARVSRQRTPAVASRGIANEALSASEMVFDCTELNANPNVSVISTAKVTAHQRLCRPLSM